MRRSKSLSNYMQEVKAFSGTPLTLDIKDGVGELTIYDFIDPYWGISADSVVKTLAGQTLSKLVVRINSPGGDVFEGIAIYNFLRSRSYPVETINDGLAASIASIILMAGSVVKTSARALIMVHDPWMMTMGNAVQIRTDADLLDKTAVELRQIYVTKSGITDADIGAMMAEETWLTAEEALSMKLVDEIIPDIGQSNQSASQDAQAHSQKVVKALYNRAPDIIPAVVPVEPVVNPDKKTIEQENNPEARARAKAISEIAALSS